MKDKINSMIRNAWDFQEAAYRCKEPMCTKTTNVVKVLFIAEMSNLAFSCEIYLKTLFYITNKYNYKKTKGESGHELDLIFQKLDDRIQNTIIQEMDYTKQDFIIEIKKHANFFKKWRYWHEMSDKDSIIDDRFLLKLCYVLYDVCNRAKK